MESDNLNRIADFVREDVSPRGGKGCNMTRDERIETAARTLRAIFAVGSPELDDREVAVAVVNAAYPELRPWLRESLDRRARRLKQEEAE